MNDLKGGSVDALIVYATYVGKHGMLSAASINHALHFVPPSALFCSQNLLQQIQSV